MIIDFCEWNQNMLELTGDAWTGLRNISPMKLDWKIHTKCESYCISKGDGWN